MSFSLKRNPTVQWIVFIQKKKLLLSDYRTWPRNQVIYFFFSIPSVFIHTIVRLPFFKWWKSCRSLLVLSRTYVTSTVKFFFVKSKKINVHYSKWSFCFCFPFFSIYFPMRWASWTLRVQWQANANTNKETRKSWKKQTRISREKKQ